MITKGVLLLCALALPLGAGCASGGLRSVTVDPTLSSNEAGTASPPNLPTLDCRNRGVYNRAAGLCVSDGP